MTPQEDTWSPSRKQQERDAYRKRQNLRSLLIAAVSTLVIGGALIAAVTSAPGWERTRTTFFNWDKAVESFPAVLEGFWINVQVFAVSAVAVLVVGMLLAVLKTLKGPVFWPLRAWPRSTSTCSAVCR